MRQKLLRATAVLSLASPLTAATTPVTNQTAPLSIPAEGTENDVSVGDALLTQGTLTAVKGVQFPEPFKVVGISFSGGFYRETGEDDKYIRLHATERPDANGYGAVLPKKVIGIDMMEDGVDFKVSKQAAKVCFGANCSDAIFGLSTKNELSENTFQQTLIYNGMNGNSIKVGYREFKDDMTRASFSNEIEYDMSKSKFIAYKRARIEIIEADNTHIRYKVIANFN